MKTMQGYSSLIISIFFIFGVASVGYGTPTDTLYYGTSVDTSNQVGGRGLHTGVLIDSGGVVVILGFLDLEEPANYAWGEHGQLQLRVGAGATLVLGEATDTTTDTTVIMSEFHVRIGTRLVLEPGAKLVINKGSQIIVEQGGEIEIQSGVEIASYQSQSIIMMSGANGHIADTATEAVLYEGVTGGIEAAAGGVASTEQQSTDECALGENCGGGGDPTPEPPYVDPIPSLVPEGDTVYINKLAGIVDVSATGGLTYAIPIGLAPGTAGIQPQLAIVYNSQGGDGMLGKGMALSGLSAITRTGKNFYMDGKQSGIQLDSSDALVLDGQRLVYTGSGSTRGGYKMYDTEIAGFSEVVTYGSGTAGADSIKVYAKDGSLIKYGCSIDSRVIFGTDTVYQYLMSRQEDANGNYIEYEYYPYASSGNKNPRVKEIRYTGSAGFLPYNKVVFTYVANTQWREMYVSNGHIIANDKKLSEIVCYAENTVYQRYQLYYDVQGNVKALRQYDGNNSLIGELRFYRGNGTSSHSFMSNTRWTDWFGLDNGWGHNSPRMLGDVNGDGKQDIVGFSEDGVDVSLSTGNGFVNSGCWLNGQYGYDQGWRSAQHSRHVVDVNGDGLADVLGLSGGSANVYISLSNGTGFNTPIIWIMTEYSGFTDVKACPRYVADFNGDGLPDIIGIGVYGVVIALNGYGSGIQGFPSTISKSIFNYASGWEYYASGWDDDYYDDMSTVADINGDGRADVIAIKKEKQRNWIGVHTHDVYTLHYALSNGTTLGDDVTSVVRTLTTYGLTKSRQYNYFFEDVNGDGKADYIFTGEVGMAVCLATGNGFAAAEQWTTYYGGDSEFKDGKYKMRMSDVNGDGLSDIIAFTSSGVRVLLSTGHSFAEPTLWNGNPLWNPDNASNGAVWGDEANIATLGDVNGDGSPDLVGFVNNGVYVSKNQVDDRALLRTVKDNLNTQFTATYGEITNNAIYTKGDTLSYPLMRYQGALTVCARLLTRSNDNYYSYEGAKIHLKGKGFLGFDKMLVRDNMTDRSVETSWGLNTTYYVPLPATTIVKVASVNKRLTQTTQGYTIASLGSKRIYPKLTSQAVYDSLSGVTQSTAMTYDSYGNVLASTTTNGGTSVTVTTNTYLTTASRSYSNRLSTTESKTYKTNPSTSYPQRQKFTYDTKGNVLSVIENYGLPIACTTSNVLNSYGLPIQSTLTAPGIPARVKSYGYDSKYRYQTSVTTGIGRSAKRYNALGQLLNDTAIGGQVTSYSYDRFGTLVQTQHPGGIVTNYKIRRYNVSDPEDDSEPNEAYVATEQTTGQAYTKQYMDILGRVVATEQPNPSGIVSTETNYNTKGQVTAVSIPHYTNETVQWKTYAYDVFGRQTAESYQGQTTSYGYSGLTSTVTSPSGQVSSKTYNAAGDLVTATDNGGTITYAYDVPGYVKTITAPGSAVTQINYDSYGRQTSITDPDAGTVSYTYNVLGDIITQTDALNHVTTNAYDANGRLSTVTESGGRVTTYTYISTGANKGQLQSISCNNGSSHSYTYDAYNRTTQFTDVLGTNTLTTQYQYNSYGQLYRQQYPSGLRLLYYYNNGYQVAVLESYEDEDEDEEVEAEEEGGGEGENVLLWSLGSVNARGQELSSMLMDGNRTQTNTYNAFGQLTARTITGLMNQTYSYQASTGNMTQRVDNLHSKTENFTYDNLSRLTTGTGYHSNGNIASKTGVGYYDYHPSKKHAVIKIVEMTAGFCNQNITYNSFNKVNGIVYSGCVGVEANMEDEVETGGDSYALSMSFVYGPTHERRKVSGHDMLNNAFERYYSTNYERTVYGGTEVVKEYIFSPYGLIAIRNNGVIKEVATDHLGSIIAEYKPGTGYEYFGYDAWGRRYKYGVGNVQIYFDTNTTLRDGAHLLSLFTRGYTGHEHLDMFGLINMNGRLYDPAIGRMLSPDPYVPNSAYTQDFNRYTYARNNPLTYIDPDGEWIHIPIMAVVYGTINVAKNWNSFKGEGFWTGFGKAAIAFHVGGGEGALTAVCPWAGAIIGGGITSGVNEMLRQSKGNGFNFGSVDWGKVGVETGISAAVGAVSFGVGKGLDKIGFTDKVVDGLGIKNRVMRNLIGEGAKGAVKGIAGGITYGVGKGVADGEWDNFWKYTWQGGAYGFAGGVLNGGITEIAYQVQLRYGRNKILNSDNTGAFSNGVNTGVSTEYMNGIDANGNPIYLLPEIEIIANTKTGIANVYFNNFNQPASPSFSSYYDIAPIPPPPFQYKYDPIILRYLLRIKR